MNYNPTTMKNNAPAVYEPADFLLPDMVQSDDVFTQEELDEDFADLSLSFQRAKIPGGGVVQFEMASDDPQRPNYIPSLQGIILYSHKTNAYWPEGQEYDDSTPPLCSSLDGCKGIGTPGGFCEACPMNMFGSSAGGRGKACKNMRTVYLLQSGDLLPIQLQLPPTSLKNYNDFISSAFAMRRRAPYGSLVEVTLTRKSSSGNDYSVANWRRLYDFEGDMLHRISDYTKAFRAQAKLMQAKRTEAALQIAAEADCSVMEVEGEDAGYYGIGEINAEVSGLPH